jgi:hypothetical protein
MSYHCFLTYGVLSLLLFSPIPLLHRTFLVLLAFRYSDVSDVLCCMCRAHTPMSPICSHVH